MHGTAPVQQPAQLTRSGVSVLTDYQRRRFADLRRNSMETGMPFELIVEDGSIVEGANSYVGLDEADRYLDIDPRGGPKWAGLEEEERERLLAYATRYIDENYIFAGRPTTREQELKWPRRGMTDIDGYHVADAVIPRELRHATAQLAVWLDANDPAGQGSETGIKRFRNEEVEMEWQDGHEFRELPNHVTRLLAAFGTGPGQRGQRRIIRK